MLNPRKRARVAAKRMDAFFMSCGIFCEGWMLVCSIDFDETKVRGGSGSRKRGFPVGKFGFPEGSKLPVHLPPAVFANTRKVVRRCVLSGAGGLAIMPKPVIGSTLGIHIADDRLGDLGIPRIIRAGNYFALR